MSQTNFQKFSDNYTSEDFDKIKFDWNGLHGDKLHDNNMEFRTQLCEYLIPQLDKIRLDLIRDLYVETAKSAKETWGIYNKFHLFGDQLLRRGLTTYLFDYLEGASKSMDTLMASARLTITKDQATQILDFVNHKLNEDLSEKERTLLEQLARPRFLKFAK